MKTYPNRDTCQCVMGWSCLTDYLCCVVNNLIIIHNGIGMDPKVNKGLCYVL